jgi:pilus assembly protein CpaB
MMFKKRGLVLVAVSLVIGLGAALVANNWMQSRVTGAADDNNSHVASAAMSIPYGTKIEVRHVKMVLLPDNVVPTGAIQSIEQI